MEFELRQHMPLDRAEQHRLLQALHRELEQVAYQVQRQGSVLVVTGVKASWGSINRKDVTRVEILETEDGLQILAKVSYKPSLAFWILLGLLLLTYVMWLVPLVFLITQKKTVQEGIQEALHNVRNEFCPDS